MKKVLLWDFDNTLGYRDGMWTKSMYDVLQENGYKHIEQEAISPYMKNGFPWHRHKEAHVDYFNNRTWWAYVNSVLVIPLIELGIPENQHEAILQSFRMKYMDINYWYLYEDTLPALEKSIALGYTNILLSNHIPELVGLVQGLGIEGYFNHIISSANIGYDKPHKRIYEKALGYCSNQDDIIMIGDNYEADILGAKSAGIKGILVRKDNVHDYPYYAKTLEDIWQYIN